MGYVFEETPNPIVDGVVHMAWKDVSGNITRRINLACTGKWIPKSTQRSSRPTNCIGCLAELLRFGEG